ncbi:MAG: hypothetical protein Q9M11_03465 [Mariprofundaceae bacterium]|nr:hypothetical protein [Mariprofundaceae bacterium]
MEYKFKPTTFNLDILVLAKEQTRQMTPVTKLNIFEPSSNNFDTEGLFSTEIFGAVGSAERTSTFSYMDLKVAVLHPLVYKHVISVRAFYKDVMAGTKYAVFDKKTKDLVLSNEEDGRTGYAFFMEVLGNLKLDDKDSDMRKFRLYMIANYGTPEYMLKQFLVLPAGMRDYKVNDAGRPEEDEINDKYRKLLMLSNTLNNIEKSATTIGAIDNVRYRIQTGVLELYEHIMGLLDGKRKHIQGKWGSRGIMYGTRNIITPSLVSVMDLDSPNDVTIEHTTIGLYQYARGITPIAMNRIHTVFVSRLFSPDTSVARLVNTKTLHTETVEVGVKSRDAWLTLDGLDHMLGTMGQDDLRAEPVMVGKHYLMLIHDDGKVVTPVFDTDNMPDTFTKDNLRPITYYELLFIALLNTFDKYRGLLTRYPVINLGGIYPSKIYVKSTDQPRKVSVDLGTTVIETTEYPNYAKAYYNSLSPHYAFLAALGGDHDGDFKY